MRITPSKAMVIFISLVLTYSLSASWADDRHISASERGTPTISSKAASSKRMTDIVHTALRLALLRKNLSQQIGEPNDRGYNAFADDSFVSKAATAGAGTDFATGYDFATYGYHPDTKNTAGPKVPKGTQCSLASWYNRDFFGIFDLSCVWNSTQSVQWSGQGEHQFEFQYSLFPNESIKELVEKESNSTTANEYAKQLSTKVSASILAEDGLTPFGAELCSDFSEELKMSVTNDIKQKAQIEINGTPKFHQGEGKRDYFRVCFVESGTADIVLRCKQHGVKVSFKMSVSAPIYTGREYFGWREGAPKHARPSFASRREFLHDHALLDRLFP